jgi:anaerobic ribonucleoside-triphosphate reductase activating protein
VVILERYNDILLNIALIVPRTTVAGPGLRTCIWFQGCSLKCPGCQNPEYQVHEPKYLLEPKELFELIEKNEKIDGITISGGEPFQQAKGLYHFLELWKKTNKTTIIFSGYEKQNLENSSNSTVRNILNLIDCLISGPYRQELKNNNHSIGSFNKQISLFTNRLNLSDFSNLSWELAISPEILKKWQLTKTDSILTEFTFDGQNLCCSGKKNNAIFEILKKLEVESKSKND